MANFSQFVQKFGKVQGDKFGPLAAQQWLNNASALTYVRVAGAGDAKKRSTSTGKVNNAGFVVGQQEPLDSGILGDNPNANTGGQGAGRTYFLGCYMSQSTDSSIFTDAGITTAGHHRATPILRGVIFAASGVVPRLSDQTVAPGAKPSATANSSTQVGAITGSVVLGGGRQEFIMLLNGHKNTPYKNFVSASFDPLAPNYMGKVFNQDPLKIQDYGYVMYADYPVYPDYAVLTGTMALGVKAQQIGTNSDNLSFENIAFLTTGTLARNAASSVVPNYEGFQERFAPSKSPFVISQKIGGANKNLFRVHSLSPGPSFETK